MTNGFNGQPDRETLERMIDENTTAMLIDTIADLCWDKAEHISENWQDLALARRWVKAAKRIETAAARCRDLDV